MLLTARDTSHNGYATESTLRIYGFDTRTRSETALRPSPRQLSPRIRGMLIVGAGVFIMSFDALLVRLAETSIWNVAFWRGLFIALSLWSLQALRLRGRLAATIRAGGLPLLGVGVIMGSGSLSIVSSFTLTLAANTVVILSAAPLVAAVLSRLLLGESCRPRTWVAIAGAMVGVWIVVSGSVGQGNLLGDVLAVAATLFMGTYLTLLRRYPDISRLLVVGLGGACMALVAVWFAAPFSLPAQTYAVLALMGLVQMPAALALVTTGTRYLPSPEVGLFLLGETILAPIWVGMALGEIPAVPTLAGGALILLALTLNACLALREQSAPPNDRQGRRTG